MKSRKVIFHFNDLTSFATDEKQLIDDPTNTSYDRCIVRIKGVHESEEELINMNMVKRVSYRSHGK